MPLLIFLPFCNKFNAIYFIRILFSVSDTWQPFQDRYATPPLCQKTQKIVLLKLWSLLAHKKRYNTIFRLSLIYHLSMIPHFRHIYFGNQNIQSYRQEPLDAWSKNCDIFVLHIWYLITPNEFHLHFGPFDCKNVDRVSLYTYFKNIVKRCTDFCCQCVCSYVCTNTLFWHKIQLPGIPIFPCKRFVIFTWVGTRMYDKSTVFFNQV